MAKNLRRWEVDRGFTAAEEVAARRGAVESPVEQIEGTTGPPPSGDSGSGSSEVSRPAGGAPKAAWVDYAHSLGWDVEGLTRTQIIDTVTPRR